MAHGPLVKVMSVRLTLIVSENNFLVEITGDIF